jgi:hypothetical protein
VSGRSDDSTRLEPTVDDGTGSVEVAVAQAAPQKRAAARNIERDITSATLRRRSFPSVEAKCGSTGDVAVDVVLDLTADHAGQLDLLVAIGVDNGNGASNLHAEVGVNALGGNTSESKPPMIWFASIGKSAAITRKAVPMASES